MESYFIEPSSLPGGNQWAKACSAIVVPKDASEAAIKNAELLRESLRCDASSIGGFFQILLLLAVYGCILFYASNKIATGSELLLLVKALRDIVGSIVLPILGAVPDGAIVLFSGLGKNAQEEVAIGVGALAGSTIMLLTIPWFLSILAGRVNLRSVDGEAMYHHNPRLWPPDNYSLTGTAVKPKGMVQSAGRFMLLTCLSYVVIQGLALGAGTSIAALHTKAATAAAAKAEHNAAIFVLVVCLVLFAYYLYSQFRVTPEKTDNNEAKLEVITLKEIQKGEISLTAAFDELWTLSMSEDPSESSVLINSNKKRLINILKHFFNVYDYDKNGHIDAGELGHLMTDLGECVDENRIAELLREMDSDHNGTISLNEFSNAMPKFIRERAARLTSEANGHASIEEGNMMKPPSMAVSGANVHEDSDEEEEIPEDLKHDDPYTQRRRILMRACGKMITGTVLVLIFSDPMVGVMNEMGKRTGISAFYISFALAPLASNASEVIAAYSYATKKTRRTITISFSTLLGAAILNNTFVLAIFMILIVVKGLAWQFTAETIAILFVECAIGWMSQKKVQTLRDGFLVLSLYPASIALVAFLENVIGLD